MSYDPYDASVPPWVRFGFEDSAAGQAAYENIYGQGATGTDPTPTSDPVLFGGTNRWVAPPPTPGVIVSNPHLSAGPALTPTPAPAPDLSNPTTAPAGPTSAQRDAQALIDDLLSQYGLQSLSGWAWDMITQGASTSQVTVQLRQRPEFQARFPAISEREKAGLDPISPAEYISLERSYTQVMRSAGLPSGFWDQPQDFHSLVAGDVSPTELQSRVENAFTQVNNAPQSVKDAFAQYYGVQGPAALASLVLDETRATPQLEKMAQTAMVGGTSSEYGLPLDQATASRIAGLGISEYRLRSGFDQAAQLRPLYDETVSEQNDITGQQGVLATLGLSPDDAAAVQNRLQGRTAAFAGGGGSVLTRQGLAGLGGAITNE